MLQTTSNGERFVHRDLWQVVVGQLDQAKKDKSGSFYNHLVAMVFSFHTLEAYVNFITEKLRPELLEYRKKGGFASFYEKLEEVRAELGLEEPDGTSRPFSTILELKELRDKIAHGRREVISAVHLHPTTEPPWDRGFLESAVTAEKAAIAAEDVERFAEWIHAAARRKLPADVSLKQGEALRGILQITSRTTTAAPER